MELDLVGILLRWMHIFAAIALFGGLIYQRVVLWPAAASLPDDVRRGLWERSRSCWARIVMISAFFLLVSGLINFILTMKLFKAADVVMPKFYHPLFGIKFLLAMAIFFLASVLAGRTAGTQKFRDHAAKWLTVNLILATLVVAISGILRSTHIAPNALEGDRAGVQDEKS